MTFISESATLTLGLFTPRGWMVQHSGIIALAFHIGTRATPNAHSRNPASGKEKTMDLKQLREGHGEVVTREFKGLVFAIALPFSGQRSDVEVWMGKNDDYLRFVVTLNIYGPVTTQLSTNTDSAPITAAEFEICHELLTSNQRILVWDELDLSSRERNSLENSVFEFGDQIAFKRDRRKIEDAMRKSPELVKALITIARTLQGI